MIEISCKSLNKNSTLALQENILDAFEKISLELPSGCRSGSCGVCVVEILEGQEQLTLMTSIEKNTLERLYPEAIKFGRKLRLACRAQLAVNKNIPIKIQSNLVDL